MASQTIVNQLIAYYINLLIIQYNNQPNAQAEIALIANTFIANGLALDVQAGYNINANLGPTAIGKQLDVIGKYTGVNRFYSAISLTNYFSFISYSEVASPPASPPRFGFDQYSTFNNNNYNGTLDYQGFIGIGNQLNDASFLTLILLAIILNNSNFSNEQIDAALYNFFGIGLRAEDNYNMSMVFFIGGVLTPLLNAIVAKNLLPKPMAMGAAVVSGITGPMFGFTSYSGYQSPFAYGFSQYSNYATLAGQDLTYSQITIG